MDYIPPWLEKLLKFDLQERCHYYPTCLDNYYCIDCMCNRLCFQCDHDHYNHETLLIMKYDGQSVVRVSDMSEYIDTSDIFNMNCNGDDVVFLEKKGNHEVQSCEACSNLYRPPIKFCSIACKFKIFEAINPDEMSSNMEGRNIEEEEESTLDKRFIAADFHTARLADMTGVIPIIVRGGKTRRLLRKVVEEHPITDKLIIRDNQTSGLEDMVEEHPTTKKITNKGNQSTSFGDVIEEPPIMEEFIIRHNQTSRLQEVFEEPPISKQIIITCNQPRRFEDVAEESLSSNQTPRLGDVVEEPPITKEIIISRNQTPRLGDVVDKSPITEKIRIRDNQTPRLLDVAEEPPTTEQFNIKGNQTPRLLDVDLNF